MTRFFSLINLITMAFAIFSASVTYGDDIEDAATSRLVEGYISEARSMTMLEPLTTDAIQASLLLLKRCIELNPNDLTVWQSVIEVAKMAEDDALVRESIQAMLRLAPDSSSFQLARLREAIDALQTVSERQKIYSQLLSSQGKSKLDSRVASRLAFDAALLYRSLGDVESFAVWLAESIALDPANPESISLGVGFFGDESADPIQRVELLGAAALSNPLDVTNQVALAEFLLAYGDYQSARRLYDYILEEDAADVERVSDGLLADIVLSQWADGDPVAGLDAILTRQIEVDRTYRQNMKAQQPRMTPLELARIHAPLVPKLATVRAAIYSEMNDETSAAISLEAAADTCALIATMHSSQKTDESTLRAAESFIQAAWLTLWLGGDIEIAQGFLVESANLAEMDSSEQQRFDGWIALRSGNLKLALQLLTPLTDDPAAKAGAALALLSTGKTKEAATKFLDIARLQGGTILGVWARNRLQNIVGKSFDVREEVGLLRPLAEQIIGTFELIKNDPRPPFTLRVEPTKSEFKPYEPVILEIELKNNTTVPLTIERKGAIQPLILIEPLIDISAVSISNAAAVIVPINTQISIPPRGTYSFEADLRQYWVGKLLNQFPLQGASIHLRSIANFSARQTTRDGRSILLVYEPSRTGIRHDSDYFRVNGFRLTDVWLNQAFQSAKALNSTDSLTNLVLLSFVINDEIVLRIIEPPIPLEGEEETAAPQGPMRVVQQDDAVTLILSEFPKLGPMSQAWFIYAMANEPSIMAVLSMAEAKANIDAQIAWLLRFNIPDVPDEALDDAGILSALQSENQSVKLIATWIYERIQIIVKARAERELALPRQ